MSQRTLLPALVLVLGACSDDGGAEATTTSDSSETTSESETTETTAATETTEGEAGPDTTIPEDAAWVAVELDAAIAQVDERYLSYAIDSDKIVFQQFDITRERLLNLTAALSPALLRVGGTKADKIFYDLSEMPVDEAPEPYTGVMGRAKWDPLCDFAAALDVEMMFTINAGPGPRNVDGLWVDDQARELLEYSVAQDCPVEAWEFGNEVGAFGLNHDGFSLSGLEYAADFEVLVALMDEVDPEALSAGPASAYWPVEGEVPLKVLPEFVATSGDLLDILTWHYYPMQSTSCPVGTRKIGDPLIPLDWLETIEQWATEVEDFRDNDAPQAALWIGESGHAQCGGEPGVSNTFASSFWWLDQLGRVAVRGQQPIVVRQALTGGHYALVEDLELAPAPDYYASVLWKRHMGARVLDATLSEAPQTLHAYAHCDVDGGGSVAMVLINYDPEAELSVALLDGQSAFEASIVTAAEITSTEIAVNGGPWIANEDGTVPVPAAVEGVGSLVMPPLSYAFVRLPEANATACD